MKRFKVCNMNCYGVKDGDILTEKELRDRCCGWIEYNWNGTAKHFNNQFESWRIVRVKRRFQVVEVGDWWCVGVIESGKIFKKKELLEVFESTLKNWDGSIEKLNELLKDGVLCRIKNSQVVFKEIYVEVEDK